MAHTHTELPTRTSNDYNAAADVNQLNDNIENTRENMEFSVGVPITGLLYVADAQVYVDLPFAGTLTKIIARVGTCETGDTVDIDVREVGAATILNADISIAQDAYTASVTSFAVTSFAQNDRLLIDINGCTIAADLMLTFIFTKTLA